MPDFFLMKLIDSGIFLQRRVREGDIKAFETLFKEFYAPLVRFAYGFVNDRDTAEEMVQDFFYHYWKNREGLEIKVSLKAYLYSSVKNFSIKFLEKQQVRRRYAERMLAQTEEAEATSIVDEMGARELQQEINRALGALPERCRTIFKMNRYQGKKYHEIAEALSVSVKTVEADMTRTLKVLRQSLASYQKEPEIKS